jgi:hypothetical protein
MIRLWIWTGKDVEGNRNYVHFRYYPSIWLGELRNRTKGPARITGLEARIEPGTYLTGINAMLQWVVTARVYRLNLAADRSLPVSLNGSASWTARPTAHCLCRYTGLPPEPRARLLTACVVTRVYRLNVAAKCSLPVLVLTLLIRVARQSVGKNWIKVFSHYFIHSGSLKTHENSTGKPALAMQSQDFVSPFLSRILSS